MERGQGLMLSGRVHPAEAYRQVEFDARVHGASQQELGEARQAGPTEASRTGSKQKDDFAPWHEVDDFFFNSV